MRNPVRFFLDEYGGLDRSMYVLFAARVVNRMGDFVQLFLVLYLTGRLGFSESAAGRFILLTGIMNSAGVMAGGFIADRCSRKAILVAAQFAYAGAYLAAGFLPVSMAVPWLIFFSSPFRGATWPVNNAMVTDLTEGPQRAKAFSLLYLGTNIGVAAGPLIAGLLFENYLAWIFWGNAVAAGISALAVLLFTTDARPDREKIELNHRTRSDDERAEEGSFLQVFLRRPLLITYLVFAVLTSFVYSQHQFSLPLQIAALFPSSGARNYGYIMTVNALTVLACTVPVTYLTRKRSSIANMKLASLIYAVGFGMIVFIGSMPLFFLSTLVWTIGEILMVTNSNVFAAGHIPITHRGRFNSVISLVHGMGFAVSPVISGMIVEHWSLSVIWPITAAAALLSILVWGRRGRETIRFGSLGGIRPDASPSPGSDDPEA